MPEDEVEQQEQGQWISEDRFQFADGTVTDAEGNEIQEDDQANLELDLDGAEDEQPIVNDFVAASTVDDIEYEPEARVETEVAPARPASTRRETVRTEAPAPVVQPPAANQPIYTTEWLQEQVYSNKVLEELVDLQLIDPVGAKRRELQLATQFEQQQRQLRQYARDRFDEDLRYVEAQAKDSVNLFRAQIEAEKRNLSPEQLQQPGIARRVVAKVVSDHFTRDPLAMEEAVQRAVKGGSKPSNAPQAQTARPAPPRKVIPREERNANPGSVQRQPARRQPAAEPSGLDRRIGGLLKLYPEMSRAEAKQIAEAEIATENARPMSRS